MTSEDRQGLRASERANQFALRHIDWVLAVLITLTSLILFALSGWSETRDAGFAFLRSVEDRSLDLRFALRGPRPHDGRIVIVGIDEKTLQKVGSFPLPRKEYARLVNRLREAGARVIAFDVTFPVPESNSAKPALEQLRRELGTSASPAVLEHLRAIEQTTDQDAFLASSMKKAGNVLLGHIFLDSQPNPDLAEQYFNIAWAHSFPQVLKVNAKGAADFDMAHAWSENHGKVMAGAEANIAMLADAAASFGFINIEPDSDGTLRHALLIMRYQDQDYFPSLDLEIVRKYESIPDQDVAAYIASNGLERVQLGSHKLRPAHNGSALINYTGPYRTYSQYSMWDVISGATPAEAFRDKIVLVGGTALAIGDMRNTPFVNQDPVYMGVEVHANIIDNLLHSGDKGRGFLLRTSYEEMADIGFIFLFGLGFGFLFSRITPLYSTFLVALSLAVYARFVYSGFVRNGQWFSFVIPAATLAANYAAITSVRMIREEREKRKIRKTFSQYLSPGVIDLIEKDPQKYIRTGGEIKELTVLFSDIRGFTTLSESLTPNELVLLLNEYFGQMTDIIFATDGTLDKYIGDAIMAFWGSPYPQSDHAFRSCSCALRMVHGLTQLNAKWQAAGHPPISTGIGVNTGLVNVGNMGSARRLSWTVMGDNVNLASRLEGITKEYHAPLIISEATYQQVASQFVCRELDKIRVKGKNQPVTIYQLLDVAAAKSKYAELLGQFQLAMLAYRAQDWSSAAAGFAAILEKFPDDGPTQVFLERALEFSKAAPQAEWDGVYVMKTK